MSGKPNFITIAHAGIADFTRIILGINEVPYTNVGTRENRTFSVCIPSEDLMVQTDSRDIMTGKNPDKALLFNVFHGTLDTAPIIRECPVCVDCTLYQNVDFAGHDLLVGEIQEAYAQDGCSPTAWWIFPSAGRFSSTWRARSAGPSGRNGARAGM